MCAKLDRPVSAEVARGIIDTYSADERLGLLVWSLGRMKLWEVLKWIAEQLPEMERRRMEALMGRAAAHAPEAERL